MISLGCPKNLVDSEMILGDASGAGLRVTPSAESADVIVVNTCGFIESAKKESIDTILEACEVKRTSSNRTKVVVTGCLAQRYGEEIRNEIPEVDAILGLGEYEGIGAFVRSLVETDPGASQSAHLQLGDRDKACQAEVGRFRLTPPHFGYIKISEGCDNPCTFCAIPAMRGRFRSKPIEMIVREAKELVQNGTKEIILISQDTTSYGIDLYGNFELAKLLEALDRVEGLEWVRVLYAYPAFLTDDMLDAIHGLDKVVKYLDMPLQHISDRMLRHMGRRMNEQKTRRLLERARERAPGTYLRTTFIVGFPGETEEDFRTLCDFVQEFRFERLGVFTYSEEEGTPAAAFEGTAAEDVQKARMEELMLIQQEIAFQQNRSRIGDRVRVLVDRVEGDPAQPSRIHARTFGEAPEIDPSVLIEPGANHQAQPSASPPGFQDLPVLSSNGGEHLVAAEPVRPGDFLTVSITGSRQYDLLGSVTAKKRDVSVE